MKKLNIVLTIFLLLSFTFSLVFFSSDKVIYAQTECPSNIDPNSQACVDYLNNQINKLQKERGTISKDLKEEEYQQLSLTEKISYMNKQITDTEKVIKTLEVEIAAHDVEIKLLEKSIYQRKKIIYLF
ncbi:MAG: hypothetical protein AB9915_00020 [Candidatus Dojkabacteria bacterium]